MDVDPNRHAPVTVFGCAGAVVDAVVEEIRLRGAPTHLVTVASGWPPSSHHAVVCLDTAAGWSAAQSLRQRDQLRSHVVGVHEGPLGRDAASWAEQVGARHDVTLVRVDPTHAESAAPEVVTRVW